MNSPNSLYPGLFVVCEGVDKAGKTSILRQLEKQLYSDQGVVYHKGLRGDSLAGEISGLYPSTLIFLLEQLYLDKTQIAGELRSGKIVLQDRWYYSVITYNNPTENRSFLTSLLREPDMLLYLTCSLEERLQRLQAEPTPDHLQLLNNPEKILAWEDRLRQQYAAFCGPKYLLDTTGRSIVDCTQELSPIIQDLALQHCRQEALLCSPYRSLKTSQSFI